MQRSKRCNRHKCAMYQSATTNPTPHTSDIAFATAEGTQSLRAALIYCVRASLQHRTTMARRSTTNWDCSDCWDWGCDDCCDIAARVVGALSLSLSLRWPLSLSFSLGSSLA